MSRASQLFERWKADYDFKTFVSASVSLAVTLIFAIYNGFLGIRHASLWYGTICVYYIILVILRGATIAAGKKLPMAERREHKRNKAFFAVSLLLLLLNMSLIVPVSMMVRQQRPVDLDLIPAIAMATYTTYKVSMAAVNFRKRKESSDRFVWRLRTISFIDALVSVLTLQNTLIMANSDGDSQRMLPLTAVSSAVIWLVILTLSVAAIIKGIRGIRKGDTLFGVEKAGPEDVEALVEMRVSYLVEDNGSLDAQDLATIERDLPGYFQAHLNRDLFAYVIRDGQTIVSCAFLLIVEKPMSPAFINGRTGTVLNVYTRPPHRRRGYARAIMEELLSEARKTEVSVIELKATEDGYPLYRSVGFVDDVSKYHTMKWRPQ